MVAGGSEELSEYVLHPLDRDALQAVYGNLEAGTRPSSLAEQLGSWSDTSLHVRGEIDTAGGEIAFRRRAQERPVSTLGVRAHPAFESGRELRTLR